jgi:ADP-ribose pyrophosphatase YjhB (NUDIX family)
MVVTFDFDNTIAMSSMDIVDGEVIYTFEGYNNDIVDKIRDHIRLGDDVFIVTSRIKTKEELFPEDTIPKHLEKLGLHGYFLPNRLYYTDAQPKLQVLRQIGTELHWDDDVKEMISLKNAGIPYENPLDFYDDCNEVAKIMIFDRNDKMLILERGDAGKLWDLPGGHLKGFECGRGEYGYSAGLEREVAEETGLILPFDKKIGSFGFQWKGESQNIHIYISKMSESMPKVNLHLQKLQENDSYEWVDYKELEQFLKHSTTVLQKAVEMLPEGQLFEQNEPFQRAMKKNHRAMKARLIDTGPNKDTGGGEGFEDPDLDRSKSAPPGFGAIGEDQDGPKKKIKVKINSNIDEKKKKKKKKKKKSKKKRKYHWNVGSWWYGGGYGDSSDGGGDGGGGE